MAEDVDVSSLAELVRIRRDEDLLRERLEKMEGRKDAVSDVVYRRVKGDYESRRAALDAEARAPRERAGREYAKLKVLAAEAARALEEARLAREEVDFRHELGEFPEEDYQGKRKAGDELLAERQARVDELARLKERFLEAFPSEADLDRAAGSAAAVKPVTESPKTKPMPAAAAPVPHEPTPGTLKAALGEMGGAAAAPKGAADPAPPTVIAPAGLSAMAGAAPPARPVTVLPPPPAFSPDATVAGPPPERSPAFSPDATHLQGVSVAAPERGAGETRSATLMMSVARVLVVQDDGQGPEYVLKPEPTTVGRAPESVIRLPYPDVSRQHATIFPADGAFKIVDRGSPNGLFVNGARVKEHLLQDGDVIQVGRRKLIFHN